MSQNAILWPDLVKQWGLSDKERDYIDRQQGYACEACGSNLRTMNLAGAIMNCFGFNGLFEDFVKKYKKKLTLLEINEAGHLHQFLATMPKHTLGSYPEVNMEALPYKSESMDLIVHSDTLEHVNNPVIALTETHRVLKPGGYTCFTIPVVIGRLTKKRSKIKPSYHGSPGNDEYLVVTEYGADMWTQVMEAGFQECRLFSLDYPASVVIVGVK